MRFLPIILFGTLNSKILYFSENFKCSVTSGFKNSKAKSIPTVSSGNATLVAPIFSKTFPSIFVIALQIIVFIPNSFNITVTNALVCKLPSIQINATSKSSLFTIFFSEFSSVTSKETASPTVPSSIICCISSSFLSITSTVSLCL